MKITYDPQVDALYIRFLDEPIQVTTQRLSDEVAINYAPDGRVVGIEVLDASDYAFRPEGEHKVVLSNLTAVTQSST